MPSRQPCRKGADESACTPGSVASAASRRPGWRPSIWDRCRHRPRAVHPRTRTGRPRTSAQGRVAAPLDLAPDGVYRAAQVTLGAGGLLHHRFTLTGLPSEDGSGGLLSVALSRGSPRVGVTHHPALWSPDVPRRGCSAPPTRPPGRLVRRVPHRTRRPARRRCTRGGPGTAGDTPGGPGAAPRARRRGGQRCQRSSGLSSSGVRWPDRPRVRCRSARKERSTCRTPSSPPCASP